MTRILITGGNGFLGSGLVHQFVKNNYEVLVISRSSYNLTSVLDKITFIKNTEENYNSVEGAIRKFSPECVIHAAWDGGNSYSDVHHLNQFHKNIPLTLSLLEIINELPLPPTFIGVGSFAEYGMLCGKASEDHVEAPTNFYGLSKLTAKNISKLYCEINNIPWVWVRPCYIYGPQDVSSRLIPKTINALLSGQLNTLDSCEVKIDYLHINDFASAIDAIIVNKLYGVYNICSGKEYHLRDIIQFLYQNISPNINPVFGAESRRIGVSNYICGTNDKLKLLSGWNSTFDIHSGLLDTINYYKNHA